MHYSLSLKLSTHTILRNTYSLQTRLDLGPPFVRPTRRLPLWQVHRLDRLANSETERAKQLCGVCRHWKCQSVEEVPNQVQARGTPGLGALLESTEWKYGCVELFADMLSKVMIYFAVVQVPCAELSVIQASTNNTIYVQSDFMISVIIVLLNRNCLW